MSRDIDVVIVGGGAAGVGAARRLAGSGLSSVLLESSPRLGGRAWTEDVAGHPLDLGCGWLHSAERNSWVPVGEAAGLTLDRSEAAWGRQYADLGFSSEQRAAAQDAFGAWQERLEAVAGGSDRGSDALDPGGRHNAYVAAICGFLSGVGPDRLSARDYLNYDAASTSQNWRFPSGYGTLVASSLPSATPLHLSTPVQAIEETRDGLLVRTRHGDIAARAAILTVSTAVLAHGGLDLPAALDPWREAAESLPLGRNEKLFFEILGDPPFEPESHLFGDLADSRSCAFYIRPFGRPLIECFLGGESADVIAEHGIAAGFELALGQLAHLAGEGIRAKLRPVAGSNWSRMDRIGGGYSSALPGQAGARTVLAHPYNAKIFFAGEATSESDFSTAHGAHDSGVRAAGEAIAALGGVSRPATPAG